MVSSPSRSSTQSSFDSLQCSSPQISRPQIIPVQLLDARFVDSEKLRPRLTEIFHGYDYRLELASGQWRILGAPELTKQDKSRLLL